MTGTAARLQPDERDLRPRGALEFADVAAGAVRRSFATLAAVSLTFAVPPSAVFWLAVASGRPKAMIAAAVLVAFGLMLAHAACVDVVSDDWLGATPQTAGSLKRTWHRAGPIGALWIVGLAHMLVRAVALIVPGALAALALTPAVPAMILERVGPAAAVKRAFTLSKNRLGTHLGAIAATLALVAAALIILVQPVVIVAVVGTSRDAPLLIGAAATQLAVCVLIVPLFAAVSVAAYVDARIRKEGLDLLYLLTPAAA